MTQEKAWADRRKHANMRYLLKGDLVSAINNKTNPFFRKI